MDEKKLIEKLEEAIYEVEKYANPQIGAHDGRKRMAERVAGALAPKVKSILADEMRELWALIDAQAEDEGLWFVAQTAPEAYLQKELRRLHAAIEAAPR